MNLKSLSWEMSYKWLTSLTHVLLIHDTDDQGLQSNLSRAEQIRRLQNENHHLNQLILKMKAMNSWRQNVKTHNFLKTVSQWLLHNFFFHGHLIFALERFSQLRIFISEDLLLSLYYFWHQNTIMRNVSGPNFVLCNS